MIIVNVMGKARLFDSYREYIEYTRDIPNCLISDYLNMTIHGNTFRKRKADARDIAIIYSNTEYAGLSYSELYILTDYFKKIAKRYGLIREFIENGII